MTNIHSSAVIDPNAVLGADIEIGPYCVVGANVQLGARCKLHSHVVIEGHTALGENCEVFPFASLGHIPQDLKYRGEESRLDIGNSNVIREYVTMNPGTAGGGLVTKVGSHCLFMAQAHVAHDCTVGDHVILANGAAVAGHCVVEDHAIIGAFAAAHQFVRIGRCSFIGGMSAVESDVIPYGMVVGPRATLKGLNVVGIKRHGLNRTQLKKLREAYDLLFASEGTLSERAHTVEQAFCDDECVMRIVDFIKSDSSRPLALPKQSA